LACGARAGSAKLTSDDVAAIRRAQGKVSQAALAGDFHVTQSNISHIQRMSSWRGE
jgi:hypothetical protein